MHKFVFVPYQQVGTSMVPRPEWAVTETGIGVEDATRRIVARASESRVPVSMGRDCRSFGLGEGLVYRCGRWGDDPRR
jgi:hypothetical protein